VQKMRQIYSSSNEDGLVKSLGGRGGMRTPSASLPSVKKPLILTETAKIQVGQVTVYRQNGVPAVKAPIGTVQGRTGSGLWRFVGHNKLAGLRLSNPDRGGRHRD